MSYFTTRAELTSAKIPESTRTYGAMPHETLLDYVEYTIGSNGYKIENIEYRGAINNDIMLTSYTLNSPIDSLNPMVCVLNSYNKSKAVTIATGAVVKICLNGMIAGRDISVMKKKHSKGIYNHLGDLVKDSINRTSISFEKIQRDISIMSERKIDGYTEISHILGELHLRDSIITTNQMTKAMNEVRCSENWRMISENTMNAWNLYNNVTEALKSSHPTNGVKSLGSVHDYFMNYVSI